MINVKKLLISVLLPCSGFPVKVCWFGAYHYLIVINLLPQALDFLKNIVFCKTRFGENRF